MVGGRGSSKRRRKGGRKKSRTTTKKSGSKTLTLKDRRILAQAKKNWVRNDVVIPRGPFPNHVYVKVSDVQQGSLTFALASNKNVVQRWCQWNDPFNPSPLFGTPPIGFNQWSNFFEEFTVLGGLCEWEIGRVDSSTPDQVCVATFNSQMSTAQLQTAMDNGGAANTGTGNVIYNYPNCKYYTHSNSGANAALIRHSHYMSPKDLYPDKDIESDSAFSGKTSSYTGGYSAAINAMISYIIMIHSDPTVTPTIRWTCKMTWYMKFSAPHIVNA